MDFSNDEVWALWEPLIEAVRPKGKTPPQDLRRTLSAIVWRHDNGAKWRSVPPHLGPWWRAAQLSRSLPGVGRIVIATLLAEASAALHRRDYQALRCLSGVAPVTKRSGKSCIVLMRQAADVRLRNAVYHWARVAAQNDPICKARYKALRSRGHGHARALRSVADRLIGVACTMLKSRSVFDPKLTAKTA